MFKLLVTLAGAALCLAKPDYPPAGYPSPMHSYGPPPMPSYGPPPPMPAYHHPPMHHGGKQMPGQLVVLELDNQGGGKGKSSKGKGFWDFDMFKGMKGWFDKGKGDKGKGGKGSKGGDYDYDYDYDYHPHPPMNYGPPPPTYAPPMPPPAYHPPPPMPTYGQHKAMPTPLILIPIGEEGGKSMGKGKGKGKGKGSGYMSSMMNSFNKGVKSSYDKAWKGLQDMEDEFDKMIGKSKGGKGKGKGGDYDSPVPIILYGPHMHGPKLPSPPPMSYGVPPMIHGESYGSFGGHGLAGGHFTAGHGQVGGHFTAGHGLVGGHFTAGHGPPKSSDVISKGHVMHAQPQVSYGAPPKVQESYGPPPLTQSYGPPPVQEAYQPPPVQQSYGPPPVQQTYGPPPPKENYGPPPPKPTYGPPPPKPTYNVPEPNPVYGPPPPKKEKHVAPSRPKVEYGPPPAEQYIAPPTDPSPTYGVPLPKTEVHTEGQSIMIDLGRGTVTSQAGSVLEFTTGDDSSEETFVTHNDFKTDAPSQTVHFNDGDIQIEETEGDIVFGTPSIINSSDEDIIQSTIVTGGSATEINTQPEETIVVLQSGNDNSVEFSGVQEQKTEPCNNCNDAPWIAMPPVGQAPRQEPEQAVHQFDLRTSVPVGPEPVQTQTQQAIFRPASFDISPPGSNENINVISSLDQTLDITNSLSDIEPVTISASDFAKMAKHLKEDVSIRFIGEAPSDFNVNQLQSLISNSNNGIEVSNSFNDNVQQQVDAQVQNQPLVISSQFVPGDFSSNSQFQIVSSPDQSIPVDQEINESSSVFQTNNQPTVFRTNNFVGESTGRPLPSTFVSLSQPQVLSVSQPQNLGFSPQQQRIPVTQLTESDFQNENFNSQIVDTNNFVTVQASQQLSNSETSQRQEKSMNTQTDEENVSIHRGNLIGSTIGQTVDPMTLSLQLENTVKPNNLKTAIPNANSIRFTEPSKPMNKPVFVNSLPDQNSFRSQNSFSNQNNQFQSQFVQISQPQLLSISEPTFVPSNVQSNNANIDSNSFVQFNSGSQFNQQSFNLDQGKFLSVSKPENFRNSFSRTASQTRGNPNQIIVINNDDDFSSNENSVESVELVQNQVVFKTNDQSNESLENFNQNSAQSLVFDSAIDINNLGRSLSSSNKAVDQPTTSESSQGSKLNMIVSNGGLESDISIAPALTNLEGNVVFIQAHDDFVPETPAIPSFTVNNDIGFASEKESMKSLEKMLEDSFGPNLSDDNVIHPAKSLVETPDMSSLPLEKHSPPESTVFPPHFESDQKTTVTEINVQRQNVLRSSGTAKQQMFKSNVDNHLNHHVDSGSIESDETFTVRLSPTQTKTDITPVISIDTSPEDVVQYSSPGQKVFVQFGSPGRAIDAEEHSDQRLTRHTGTSKKNTVVSNSIDTETQKVEASTAGSKKSMVKTSESNSSKPLRIKLASNPTEPSTTSTTTTETSASKPIKKVKTIRMSSRRTIGKKKLVETSNNANNEESTSTTLRPLRLRPLVRRNGGRRRKRPMNKKSNFRSRNNRSRNRKAETTAKSTTETATTQEPILSTSETKSTKDNEIISTTPISKKLTVKSTSVKSSKSSKTTGNRFRFPSNPGVPFGARISRRASYQTE